VIKKETTETDNDDSPSHRSDSRCLWCICYANFSRFSQQQRTSRVLLNYLKCLLWQKN